MVKLSKYDKDLGRDVVVETKDPAEINKYKWGYGYKEVKPGSQPESQSAGNKKDEKDKK